MTQVLSATPQHDKFLVTVHVDLKASTLAQTVMVLVIQAVKVLLMCSSCVWCRCDRQIQDNPYCVCAYDIYGLALWTHMTAPAYN